MPTRRELLASVAAAAPVLFAPRVASAADGSFDVSYLWSKDLESVLDYRAVIATLLGDDVSADLVIVRGGTGNWGLLYDRKGTDPVVAAQVARRHHRALHAAFGTNETLATMIPDRGFSHVHHIRFGLFEREAVAQARYNRVAGVLGREVHRRLVIEHTGMTTWQVVERRYASIGDLKNSLDRYAQRLPDVPVDTIEDRNAPLAWKRLSGTPDPEADDRLAATPSVQQAEAAAGAAAHRPAGAGQAAQPGEVSPPDKEASLAILEPTASPAAKAAPGAGPSRAPTPRKPVDAPVTSGNALPGAVQTHLRDSINEYVQKLRRRGVVSRDERTSWYVHTLHDDRTWVAINAERPLQSASMVKPFVALAFLHEVSRGRFVYGPRSRANLEAMIQESSNSATNWAIAQVGGPRRVQSILRRYYGEMLHETTIVEGIPRYGRAYRNRSSARDYVRFCRALWRNELPESNELRRLMALPGRDRLATDVKGIPQTTEVLNKTGTTSHVCGDFGILVVPAQKNHTPLPYAVVGIIEKRRRARSFTAWSRSRAGVIRGVSALVYRELKSVYPIV
ncbi:MAG: serine hydrolase [Myxococcota bacterium]